MRIGVSDGFGGAFLAPRLGRLVAAHPALRVQLVPVPRAFSLSGREADVAVMVGRPEKGRLRVRRLTDYTLSLYASAGYLERHALVGYVEDLICAPELAYATEVLRGWRSRAEVSTAAGQLEAVRSGAGVGVPHDFMAGDDLELVRLFPERTIERTYWTVWHENLRGLSRVEAVVDFLDAAVREERGLFRPARRSGSPPGNA